MSSRISQRIRRRRKWCRSAKARSKGLEVEEIPAQRVSRVMESLGELSTSVAARWRWRIDVHLRGEVGRDPRKTACDCPAGLRQSSCRQAPISECRETTVSVTPIAWCQAVPSRGSRMITGVWVDRRPA
jgi:hypothetical protein